MSRKYFIANAEKIAKFLAEHGKELDKKEYQKLWYLLTRKEVTERFIKQNKLARYKEFFEETGYIKVSNYKVFFNAHQELEKMDKKKVYKKGGRGNV